MERTDISCRVRTPSKPRPGGTVTVSTSPGPRPHATSTSMEAVAPNFDLNLALKRTSWLTDLSFRVSQWVETDSNPPLSSRPGTATATSSMPSGEYRSMSLLSRCAPLGTWNGKHRPPLTWHSSDRDMISCASKSTINFSRWPAFPNPSLSALERRRRASRLFKITHFTQVFFDRGADLLPSCDP